MECTARWCLSHPQPGCYSFDQAAARHSLPCRPLCMEAYCARLGIHFLADHCARRAYLGSASARKQANKQLANATSLPAHMTRLPGRRTHQPLRINSESSSTITWKMPCVITGLGNYGLALDGAGTCQRGRGYPSDIGPRVYRTTVSEWSGELCFGFRYGAPR